MAEAEKSYKRMGDFATTAGQKFEVKITALVFLRAVNKGRKFELGTNADFAGVFDDIVLKVLSDDSERWETFFVQLKHREKNKHITRNMLLGSDPKFSLSKYYQAFLAIKTSMNKDVREVLFEGNFSDASFIIFTNAPGSPDLGPNNQEDSDMGTVNKYFGTGPGSVYRFNPDGENDQNVLQCLGQDEEMTDRKAFLQQFLLFCGQCSDENLDQLIKEQLSIWQVSLCGEGVPVELALLFDRVIADLTTWCELRVKGGKVAVMNEAATLLHDARRRVLVETSSSLGVGSQSLGVGFRAEAVTPLKDALRDTPCVVVHVEATERSTRLTCVKVFQAIGNDQLLYFPADSLLGFDGVLEWYWKQEKRQYLVVSISDADAEGEKSEKILEALKRFCPIRSDKQQRKKKKSKANNRDVVGSLEASPSFSRILVIVALQGNLIVNRLTAELPGSLKSFADVFEFSQLEDEIKKALLEETAVPVQNHPTSLLELFDGDRRKADELMVASSTADFMAGDKEQSIGPELAHVISCYIPRILEQRLDLKLSLLQLPSLDENINVVCNSFEEVWSLLALADSSINTNNIEDVIEHVSESSNVDDRFEDHIFVGEDFELGVFSCKFICLRFGQPDSVSVVRVRLNLRGNEDSPDPKWFLFVPEKTDCKDADLLADFNSARHFLRLHDGRLRWTRSLINSRMDLIRTHLDETQAVSVVSQGVAAIGDRVVLLCAEPGMGKSTLMLDVAKKTKDAHPEALVLVVTLNEHVQLFVEKLHLDPTAFLMKAAGLATNLQQLWFKLALEMENLIVLLDGFEEVCPKYEKECLSLLTCLLQTKTRKIWITSRNTKKVDLEDHLGILATKLYAFDKEDQKSFLKLHWADAMSLKNETSEPLDIFVDEVIKKTEGAINDREKDFMKVPLHTLMMAEVFKPNLSDLTRIVQNTEKLNLIDLFDRYCKIKIDIYLQNKVQLGSERTLYETILKQTEESCLEGHGLAAIMAILDDDDDIDELRPTNIRKHCFELAENFNSGQDKTGFIVSVLNGKPRFIHRVFAEYFAAKWFAKHLKENIAFLERRLYSEEFSVVREMFDSTLAKGCPLHSAVLKEDLVEVQRLADNSELLRSTDHGGRTALHLAASRGTSESGISNDRKKDILNFLVNKHENADEVDEVFSRSPLHYAAATASWPAIDRLLRCKVNKECLSTLITNPAKESMLAFASTHDLDELMKFCLAQGLPVDHSLERAGAILTVACANGSERVAMLLLQGGANVLTKDPAGTSTLQHATRTGRTALVKAVLENISDLKVKAAYIKGSDAFGENALQSATKSEFIDIVQVLLHAMPDNKDKAEFVKASDRFGDNPLLIAARKGNAAIVNMLLKTIPKPNERLAYIKSADVQGDTALRLACKDGFNEVVELILREISKPNDKLDCIKAGDFHGNNALIIATSRGYANIVRTLLQAIPEPVPRLQCAQGATMQGDTPLRLAASLGHAKVVEAILSTLDDSPEKTAYIRSCGATGECALVIATRLGHSEVVQCILASIIDAAVRLEYIQACWPGGERLLIFATRVGCKKTFDAILRAIPEERRREHVLDCWSSNGENLLGLATKLKLEEIVEIINHFFS